MQRNRSISSGMMAAAAACAAVALVTLVALVALVALVTPRAAGAQDTTTMAAPKPKKVQKGNSTLITESEVTSAMSVASTAYDVIEKVRPAMLRRRGGPTGSQAEVAGIVVYLDDVRSGDLESLRSISSNQIKEIRYISGTDATQRWGTGLTDGVIQVISKR